MDQPNPVLGDHWAELALAQGWDVSRLCHCAEPDLLALVGGDGWYANNMCGNCRRKVIVHLTPPQVDEE